MATVFFFFLLVVWPPFQAQCWIEQTPPQLQQSISTGLSIEKRASCCDPCFGWPSYQPSKFGQPRQVVLCNLGLLEDKQLSSCQQLLTLNRNLKDAAGTQITLMELTPQYSSGPSRLWSAKAAFLSPRFTFMYHHLHRPPLQLHIRSYHLSPLGQTHYLSMSKIIFQQEWCLGCQCQPLTHQPHSAGPELFPRSHGAAICVHTGLPGPGQFQFRVSIHFGIMDAKNSCFSRPAPGLHSARKRPPSGCMDTHRDHDGRARIHLFESSGISPAGLL
jgi:hypothetical protein